MSEAEMLAYLSRLERLEEKVTEDDEDEDIEESYRQERPKRQRQQPIQEEASVWRSLREVKPSSMYKGFKRLYILAAIVYVAIHTFTPFGLRWAIRTPTLLAYQAAHFTGAAIETVNNTFVDSKGAKELKKGDTINVNGVIKKVTSGVGYRDLCKKSVGSCNHKGTDFEAAVGEKICIPGRLKKDAYFTWQKESESGGYGEVVRAYNGDTMYLIAHLIPSSAPAFTNKDGVTKNKIKTGQVVGAIGMTGNVTGPHLHIEKWVAGELQVITRKEAVEAFCGSYDPTFSREQKK